MMFTVLCMTVKEMFIKNNKRYEDTKGELEMEKIEKEGEIYNAKQLVNLWLRLPKAPFFDAIDFVTFCRLSNGGAYLKCPDCDKQFVAPSIDKNNDVYHVHCPHCFFYFGKVSINH